MLPKEDKMSPDEMRPIAEEEVPKEVEQVSGQAIEPAQEERTIVENESPKEQDVPKEQDMHLTKEMFITQLQQLIERAKAAGLHPIQTMAKAYVKQGTTILEGLLSSLENENTSKKKRK